MTRAALVLAPAVLAAWLVAAIVVGGIRADDYRAELGHARARAHFYRVVAGEEPRLSVSDQLAADLRRADLRRFRGDSNRYGGITSELGRDPFTDECGVECGPLTAQMREAVARARAGGAEEQIDSERPRREASPSTAAPALLLVLWALAVAFYALRPVLRRERLRRSVRARYPAEAQLVAAADRLLRELPPGHPQRRQVEALRQGVVAGLEHRMGSGAAVSEAAVDGMVRDLRSAVEAIDEGNEALR